MVYNASYTDADLSSSVIDSIVKVFIVVGQFIILIVIILLYRWAKKKGITSL